MCALQRLGCASICSLLLLQHLDMPITEEIHNNLFNYYIPIYIYILYQ